MCTIEYLFHFTICLLLTYHCVSSQIGWNYECLVSDSECPTTKDLLRLEAVLDDSVGLSHDQLTWAAPTCELSGNVGTVRTFHISTSNILLA